MPYATLGLASHLDAHAVGLALADLAMSNMRVASSLGATEPSGDIRKVAKQATGTLFALRGGQVNTTKSLSLGTGASRANNNGDRKYT